MLVHKAFIGAVFLLFCFHDFMLTQVYQTWLLVARVPFPTGAVPGGRTDLGGGKPLAV